MENWIHNQDSFYITKDDQKIYFSDDFITSEERVTGLGKGIYSTYKYFDTYIWKEDSTNHYYFEWIPKVDENIKEVHFPDSFICEDKDGYSTIPYMQGLLIPNRYEYDYSLLPLMVSLLVVRPICLGLVKPIMEKGMSQSMKRLGILNIQLIMMTRVQDFNLYG